MADFDKVEMRKQRFLERREEVLKGRVSTAERKLLTIVVDDFLDKLEQENGQVKFNGKNISLTSALDKIFDDLFGDAAYLGTDNFSAWVKKVCGWQSF